MNTDNEFKHNKAYLMQYRRMHEKIDRLKDKLDRLDERCSLKGVSYSSQPSSTVTKTLDDILAQKEYIEGKMGIHFLVWIEIPCQIFLYKKEDICCPLVIQSIHHKNHERRLNKCPIMILS